MNFESSLAQVTLKRNGADDPAGDDRGGLRGGGTDDGTSGSSSASSSSSSASSSSSSTSSSSSSASSASSSSSSSSTDSSSASSSSTSSSSSASSASSSSSASNSDSSAGSSASSSPSHDSSSSLSSSASSASSASSGSTSSSTDDSLSSLTSSASSGSSASSSPSHSQDDSSPGYGHHSNFLFDPAAYLALNPDLAGKIDLSSALQHFMSTGGNEDRNPTRWFDADFYRASHADLAQGGFDDATLFQHFNTYGVWEGRAPSDLMAHFDGGRYLRDNPDVAAYVQGHLDDFLGSASNGAIAHFMIYGSHEARAGYDDSGHHIDPGLFV